MRHSQLKSDIYDCILELKMLLLWSSEATGPAFTHQPSLEPKEKGCTSSAGMLRSERIKPSWCRRVISSLCARARLSTRVAGDKSCQPPAKYKQQCLNSNPAFVSILAVGATSMSAAPQRPQRDRQAPFCLGGLISQYAGDIIVSPLS